MPLMTNECNRLWNPFFILFLREKRAYMDKNMTYMERGKIEKEEINWEAQQKKQSTQDDIWYERSRSYQVLMTP